MKELEQGGLSSTSSLQSSPPRRRRRLSTGSLELSSPLCPVQAAGGAVGWTSSPPITSCRGSPRTADESDPRGFVSPDYRVIFYEDVPLIEDYVDGLFIDRFLQVVRIDEHRWVVEDYTERGQNGRFVHLQRTQIDDVEVRSCDCKHRGEEDCIHLQLLEIYEADFEELQKRHHDGIHEVVEIMTNSSGMLSMLSVPHGTGRTIAGGERCIVRWTDRGQWGCMRCGVRKLTDRDGCVHRERASAFLQDTLGPEVFAQKNAQARDEEQENGNSVTGENQEASVPRARRLQNAVSYKMIPPSQLGASDHELRFLDANSDRVPRELPSPLPAGDDDQCRFCGRVYALHEGQFRTESARLFTKEDILLVPIQTRICHCRLRGIKNNVGPDRGAFGIFNWNNRILITHKLLGDFNASISAGSTSMAAFHRSLEAKYRDRGMPPDTDPEVTMVSRSTFKKAADAFSRLQRMVGDEES